MLGLAKMAPAAWRYYASHVALGLEDYFTGRGEAPGHWTGSGAAALGLDGEVDPAHLGALFGQGRHPVTGEALGTPWDHRSTDRVAGYSLSLSPPKSVSVLWGLGTPNVAAEVAAAHQAAVAAAVALLEDHAAFSRAGKAGVFQVDTGGLIVASFVHRTSRAVDPDLHTHLLVSNKVRCADGRWRALDGREVYAMQKPAGGVYQAALRAELTTRLGVEWEPVDRNGQADIVGVPEGLCRMFSTRRRQIEVRGAERVAAAEARLGRSLTDDERAETFQVATLETRTAKGGVAEATVSLLERWRGMAVAAGWAPERWLDKALGRSPAQRSLALDAGGDVVTQVVAELGEQRSTWGRTDAIKAMARRLPPGLVTTADEARAWIEAGTDSVVAHRQVVRLVAPASVEVPVALCRRDGLATTSRHGGARYTTRATLALEASVIETAGRGREARRAVATATAIDAAVAERGLGEDQAVAVRRVCGGGEALVCLVGPAGAGKTRSVGAARLAWEASGIPVRGLAVSAVAAGVLSEEAGLASDTLAKFLCENAKVVPDPCWRLRRGEAVVLDEASMVTSADLAALVAIVEAAGAKLVLVGDHRQLGAVGAGGLFGLLVADTNAAELTDARRFVEPWESEASLRLRQGDVSVVNEYERHGRLVGGDREEMVEAAFASWLGARSAGESVVVLAGDHVTVDALAMRARAVRVAAGEVEATGVVVGAQVAGVGDEVVTTENDRRLLTTREAWVRNGDRWVVVGRRGDGALVVDHADGRGRAVLPAPYVSENVCLGYAVTVHKAQGLTVDRSVVVLDDAARSELVYVAMTRGRRENKACMVVDQGGDVEHGWRKAPSPAEALADALGRSGAEQSATEVLRAELGRSDDLAVLVPQLVEVRRHISHEAGPNRQDELRELAVELGARDPAGARSQLHGAEVELQRADAAAESARAELDALAARPSLVRRRAHAIALEMAQSKLNMCLRRLAGTERQVEQAAVVLRSAEAVEADVAGRFREVHKATTMREAWLVEHPAEVAWEADLTERVADRRRELALAAERDRPAHIVRLVGPPPDEPHARDDWLADAGVVEAYREKWRVEPDRLGQEDNLRGLQAIEWEDIRAQLEPDPVEVDWLAWSRPAPDHGLDLGL